MTEHLLRSADQQNMLLPLSSSASCNSGCLSIKVINTNDFNKAGDVVKQPAESLP